MGQLPRHFSLEVFCPGTEELYSTYAYAPSEGERGSFSSPALGLKTTISSPSGVQSLPEPGRTTREKTESKLPDMSMSRLIGHA